MRIGLDIEEDTEASRYLRACARIRGISPTSLLKRVIEMVAKDQLVLSILDDEGEKPQRRPGEYSYTERSAT